MELHEINTGHVASKVLETFAHWDLKEISAQNIEEANHILAARHNAALYLALFLDKAAKEISAK
jgi:hypothetical protein